VFLAAEAPSEPFGPTSPAEAGEDNAPSPWWTPARFADKKPFLLARGRIKTALRAYLIDQGFTEIEAGQLQVSPGNETHLHGLETQVLAPDGTPRPFYLHTSPEFACKKLLAAGETRIFDFARVFRNREQGPLHATEFTMLEWYRAHQDWHVVMEDCLALVRLAAAAVPTPSLSWRGVEILANSAPIYLRVQDAFTQYAAIDLESTLTDDGEGKCDALADQARGSGFAVAPDDTWSDMFSKILVEAIEPKLGQTAPTFLTHYPACEAALARRCADDPRFSERFELYVCGVELANGFGELTDPIEQKKRFEADMAEKQRIYGETYPIDLDFLDALAIMPPASGVALGFDRLAVLATGARRIEDVLWTLA
jgi:lysyl-tRNA synthetase class 2